MIIINWTSDDQNIGNLDTAPHTNLSKCSSLNLNIPSTHAFCLTPCTPNLNCLLPLLCSRYDHYHMPSETPQQPNHNALLTCRTISSFFHCLLSMSNILQSLLSPYPSMCAASLSIPYIIIPLLFIGFFSLIKLSSIEVYIPQIQ